MLRVEVFEIDVSVGVKDRRGHGFIFLVHAPALQMNHLRGSIVNDLVAIIAESDAKVEVIAVHEESLIKQADSLEGRPWTHHEGSVYRANLIGTLHRKERQVVAGE